MNKTIIRNMLTPVQQTAVLAEAKGSHPTLQGLMDKAYAKWQKGGDLEGKSDAEFVAALDDMQELAVRVGNLNYQVENGGFSQWFSNSYGKRDLAWLLDFFSKHSEYAAFQWAHGLLSKVDKIAEGPFEIACDYCGGSGDQEYDDDETGETKTEPCDYCHGDGTVEVTDIDEVEGDLFDKEDDEFYQRNGELLAATEKYVSGKETEIANSKPVAAPAPATEPIRQRPKQNPKSNWRDQMVTLLQCLGK